MHPISKMMAIEEQRRAAAISKANREGNRSGWVYNPTRAAQAYEDARRYMGVTDADQYYS